MLGATATVPAGKRVDGNGGEGPVHRKRRGPIRPILALIAASVVWMVAYAIVEALP